MNGFKLGGSGVGTPHNVMNCLSFDNGATGFTDNNNPTGLTIVNVTAWGNVCSISDTKRRVLQAIFQYVSSLWV